MSERVNKADVVFAGNKYSTQKTGKRRHLFPSRKEVNLGKVWGVWNKLVVGEKELKEKRLRIQMNGGHGVCSQMRRGIILTLKCLGSYSL